jgi:mono/diheme cytochrome c family protein
MRSVVIARTLAVSLLTCAASDSLLAQAPQAASKLADQQTLQSVVNPFFRQHCVKCHGADKQEGELRLDTLAADFATPAVAGRWVEVMDRLNLGEMPPEDEPRPGVKQVRSVAAWIAGELRRAERAALSRGGRVLLRRMNRVEYANTIRDLLGMEFLPGEGPLAVLPPDGSVEGFDKVSTALMLDPSLLEKYFEAAKLVADKAIVDGPPPFPTEKIRYELEDTATNGAIRYLCSHPGFQCREHDVVLMEGSTRSFGVMKYPGTTKSIPTKGLYRVRVRAAADPGERGKPVVMRVTQNHPSADQELIVQVEVTATPDAFHVYEVELPRDDKGGEWHVSIVNGSNFVQYNRAAGDLDKAIRDSGDRQDFESVLRLSGRMKAEGLSRSRPNPDTADTSPLPKLYLDWIEVEGPLYGPWPPKSHELLLFKGADAQQNLDYAREIFARFMPRAFRRRIEPAEIEPIVALVKDELDHDIGFHQAIRTGVAAVLTSPSFLYLTEAGSDDVRELNDYELASRLSYFLWSSMPDDELFLLARDETLRDAATLERQVDRMLADPKAEAFVNGFGAQWLRTGEFRTFRPDERIYPEYDDELGEAMVGQTLAFFREVLQHDRPVLDFLDSDWTMLNARLARFYGIEGVDGIDEVDGKEFRRVALPEGSPRGGLLGQAGVAMYGSDGTRTKPVRRGVYIREVLLNDPPDPPPPNVGEIEPNIRGENLTVRDRLIQHQQIESCAACHRTIDPYGIALENLNVIGGWRDVQDGEDFRGTNRPPIDAGGRLPDGRAFADFGEFKSALLEQRERFSRALAEKLLIYALGRPIEPSDRPTIDAFAVRLAERNYTMRSLLKGIVSSRAFVTK